MSSSWASRRNAPANKGQYFLFAARAYPNVVKGKNATDIVTTVYRDRDAFYHDPAAKLSDADLELFNGTEGAPICVEHKRGKVVGDVRHSWIGDGDDRNLKVIGRIRIRDERGNEIPRGMELKRDIMAGRYKGVSVGYSAELSTNGKTGTTKLDSKCFREISLVEQPFFDNCHIACGVEASNGTSKNREYNSQRTFYLPIQAGMTDNAAAATPTPTAMTAANPAAAAAVPSHELVQQAERLRATLDEEHKARQDTEAKLAVLEKEARDRAERKAIKQREREAQYAAQQQPKFEQYVEMLTASKVPLTEAAKTAYRKTFTEMAFAEGAKALEAQHAAYVQLQASLKEKDEQLAKERSEREQLQSTASRATAMLNHSRSAFAAAAAAPATPARDDATAARIQAEVAAGLNRIMVPEPSLAELPFLQAYGYRAEADVVASRKSDPYSTDRAFQRTVEAAATHRHLLDGDRNQQFPASARYHAPAFFAWMCNNDELRSGDLSDVVSFVASKNVIVRKDAEEWEQRNLYAQQAQQVQPQQ
jgi:hypothetical protein